MTDEARAGSGPSEPEAVRPQRSESAAPPLPFATATIARLYMLQGKLEQADSIYQQLLRESPDDRRLLDGVAELRRRREARLAPIGEDRLELRREGERLRCRYIVTADGRRRAARVLGEAGQLVLRVMAFPAVAGAAEDHPLPDPAGDLELAAPDQARVLAAAVGLRGDGDRFVAIAHACTAGN